jgi:DNA-binding HxlR family transcriptional regulator
MALLDLLGRRWAMGVLWNLSKGGPCTFRELQGRCETISPSVLNSRLKELRESGLVEHSREGYQATARGQELYARLVPLGVWAKEWAVKSRGRSAD